MAGRPAPSPPLKPNSTAPAFKPNASGPSLGDEPAQVSSTSPAAAALPVPVPSDDALVVAVLGVVSELRARGLLAGFEIPEAELTDEGASALFDAVLTAFLAKLEDPAVSSSLPIPSPLLEDGRKVELVSLFLAVRARGGFSAVSSWAAVAEAVGLDSTADTAVELLYVKYLAPLEQSCNKRLENQMVVSGGNADLLLGSKKGRLLTPTKRPTTTSAGSAHLKGKRDALVGMLDWVHLVAKNPGKQGKNPGGHKQAVVELRRQMFADKNCVDREELVGMINWVRGVATSAGQPGIIEMNPPPDQLSTAVELRSQTSLPGMLYWVRLVATCPGEPEVMEGSSLSYLSTALLFRSQKFANKKEYTRSSAPSPQSGIPILPCGQADIPEWTGKPSSYYDDPRTLRFLGEPILFPGSTDDPDGASIGKGRQDDCHCKDPGSIACVRVHVAETKIKLKGELASAYFEMGFDRTGEDLALTWTKDEERKFNTTIQDNLPSSRYKFWDKLLAVFHDKGREGLVSYYHNVFQVRRRAYQNHLALNVDSDDDSIEPDFLYARQVADQSPSKLCSKKSRSKSAGSSRKRRRS